MGTCRSCLQVPRRVVGGLARAPQFVQQVVDVLIRTGLPPQRLVLCDESGGMRIELLLSHQDGETELQLVHHLDPADEVGDYGPGWEYYLDMLVASRDDLPTPDFDDYYPSMKPYFEALSRS